MYQYLYFIDTRKHPYLCDALAIRFEQLGYEIKDLQAIKEKGLWFDRETKHQLIPESMEYTPSGGINMHDEDLSEWDDADLDNFFKRDHYKYTKPKRVIQLTRKYKAEVERDRVKVGCQYITFDQVKEVYKAVIEQEKANEQ